MKQPQCATNRVDNGGSVSPSSNVVTMGCSGSNLTESLTRSITSWDVKERGLRSDYDDKKRRCSRIIGDS